MRVTRKPKLLRNKAERDAIKTNVSRIGLDSVSHLHWIESDAKLASTYYDSLVKAVVLDVYRNTSEPISTPSGKKVMPAYAAWKIHTADWPSAPALSTRARARNLALLRFKRACAKACIPYAMPKPVEPVEPVPVEPEPVEPEPNNPAISTETRYAMRIADLERSNARLAQKCANLHTTITSQESMLALAESIIAHLQTPAVKSRKRAANRAA